MHTMLVKQKRWISDAMLYVVMILVSAPLIERTQHIASLKAVFSIITATVGGAVRFPTGQPHLAQVHWPSVAWLLVLLVALHRFKANMIGWIGVSA